MSTVNIVNILVIESKRGVTVEVLTSNPEVAKFLLKHGFRSRTSLCNNPDALPRVPCRYEKTFSFDYEARYFVRQLELVAAQQGLDVSVHYVKSISLKEEK